MNKLTSEPGMALPNDPSTDPPIISATIRPAKNAFGRVVPLLVLLGCILVVDLAIATVVDAQSDMAGGLVVGFVFAQIVLAAVWTALGPFQLYWRLVVGILGAVVAALTLVICIKNSGVGESQLLWFGIVLLQCFVIQIPFWIGRSVFGLQLTWHTSPHSPSRGSDKRFGIGQLMIWTAMVAVTLGIGRFALPEDEDGSNVPTGRIFAYGLVLVFNCLLAWPLVWAMFLRRVWALWVLVAVGCSIGLTFAEVFALDATGQGGDPTFFCVLNSVLVVASAASLLVIRLSGLRLERRGEGQKIS